MVEDGKVTFKAVGAGNKDKDKEPEDIAAGQLMGIPEKPAEKPKAKAKKWKQPHGS